MGEQGFPPAVNGTELRLDAIHAELRALNARLSPAETTEPRDGEAIELREPEIDKPGATKRTKR